MSGGGYRGGSTLLTGFSTKMPIRGGKKLTKKEKVRRQQPPGLHVLSAEERKAILKRIRESRSASIERERVALEMKRSTREKTRRDFLDQMRSANEESDGKTDRKFQVETKRRPKLKNR